MAENTNLKYEQINWGWLNDYAGYKFAPITFFDNLYTEDGKSFKDEYNKVLDNLKNGKFLVGRAEALAIPNNDDSSDLIETNPVKPVYFANGQPVSSDELQLTTLQVDDAQINIIDNDTINSNIINSTTINSDINFTNPIVLNFSGTEINPSRVNITKSNLEFDIDLSLKTSGVSAGSYGPSSGTTLAHEGTFSVPYITVDSKGRLTAASTKTYTLPAGNKVSIAAATSSNTVTSGDNWTKRYLLTNSATGSEATDNKLVYYSSIYVDFNGSAVSSAVLMGAAWNDYAEYRNQVEEIEPGYCVASTNQGKVYKTTEKYQACDGIVSDTYGFTIGKTNECQTPLAVSGRVLAYFHGSREDYNSGDTVCAGPEGKIMKMTREEIREYPDRIIGIVSEIPEYEEWNGKKVNNRIWIKVK